MTITLAIYFIICCPFCFFTAIRAFHIILRTISRPTLRLDWRTHTHAVSVREPSTRAAIGSKWQIFDADFIIAHCAVVWRDLWLFNTRWRGRRFLRLNSRGLFLLGGQRG